MTLHVGSLFSGIGGIDLGLERCGMTVKWQSEIEPYSCRVLAKHWPDVPNLGDIKKIDWEQVEVVDVIAGGYPCQPFSTAGKRGGTDDPRHLWPEMLRAISVLRPRVAFLENVRGHYSLGFERVLGDLADIGYDCEWEIVSAQSVGAPHRRERLICLAYPSEQQFNGRGCGHGAGTVREWSAVQESACGSSSDVAYTEEQSSDGEPDYFRDSKRPETIPELGDSSGAAYVANTDCSPGEFQREREVSESDLGRRSQNVAYTDSDNTTYGRQRESLQGKDRSRGNDGSGSGSDTGQISMGSTRQDSSDVAYTDSRQTGGRLGSQSADRGQVQQQRDHFGGEEGYAGGQWWEVEPDVGRVAHGIPARVDRLRGLGNAVVPQVAEVVGRVIVEMLTPG